MVVQKVVLKVVKWAVSKVGLWVAKRVVWKAAHWDCKWAAYLVEPSAAWTVVLKVVRSADS